MSKDATKKNNSLYDALRIKGEQERASQSEGGVAEGNTVLALDDTERTKVLSPGRLVTKRFFRNRLALVGLCILVFMFVFAFAGPIVYPYSQTRIFYKYDTLRIDYASATERTEYILYAIPGGPEIRSTVLNRFNSYIAEMEAGDMIEMSVIATDDTEYHISKLGDKVFLFSVNSMDQVGTYLKDTEIARYDRLLGTFEWTGESYSDEFKNTAVEAIGSGAAAMEYDGAEYSIARVRNLFIVTLSGSALELYNDQDEIEFQSSIEDHLDGTIFEFEGATYTVENLGAGSYAVFRLGDVVDAYLASTYVFNSYDTSVSLTDEFRRNALLAIYENGAFTADGDSYTVSLKGDDLYIADSAGQNVAALSDYAIRRYSGQDTLTIEFKNIVQDVIENMLETGNTTDGFSYPLQEIDGSGNFVFDAHGVPVYADTEIQVVRKATGEYVLTCNQITYLIDIFAPPSSANKIGTDGDGMDILARMMYGGRISLMVGFVVVFLEIFIGVVLGGISGFFSGPVDTLIMRIADIFYCIPSYPILIIMGALFDKLKMDPYTRIVWMMVILGVLGWATVARLVRGQILSLREQEFMHAQEATGMKNRRRIFRHLVPNVMPQLIVTATMGVGEVIIYESTLSFLGLGVKHPLATWGTMINSVTGSSESMIKYTYIWIPVGVLICLTVIAFNFVGDGLRDAFDPKMKR